MIDVEKLLHDNPDDAKIVAVFRSAGYIDRIEGSHRIAPSSAPQIAAEALLAGWHDADRE